MSEILKVLNKKVELKSEVVEFNIVTDLAAAVNSVRNALSEGTRNYDNMYARRNVVEQALEEINMLKSDFRDSNGKKNGIGGALQDVFKLSDKLEAAAKELGIKPIEVKGVKEAMEYQKKGTDMMKKIEEEQKRTEKTLKKL